MKKTINQTKYITEYENMKNKPILFVRDLTKRYFGRKAPAISDISFDVFPGEFHAFIGANGAGKTTTIKSIIGAYAKWSGTILINGEKNNKRQAKLKLGYIPESARFPEKFSTYNYLVWMIMLSGFSKKEAVVRAKEQLKDFNMWNLRHKSPNDFSSGQKKKILLAQALIHNPDVIVMDEPVANLDPKARLEFFDTLLNLKKKGKAIFVSSHVLAELDIYFDSATILDGGKIVFSGTKTELYKLFPKDKYICVVSKPKVLMEALDKKFKIPYVYVDSENKIIFNPKTKKQADDVLKFIAIEDMYVYEFIKTKPSLEDVYRKLIIKGSVDTMQK